MGMFRINLQSNIFQKEYELILVLNGCDEPYGTRIVSWLNEHTDLQVLYIQTDIGGVSNARNMALDIANGEYITFIDDDDFISPSYLKELYEKASRTVVSLCYPLSFVDKTTNYIEYYITGDYNRNFNKKRHFLRKRQESIFQVQFIS